MVSRILELTKFEAKDGNLFDTMDAACEHQNIHDFTNDLHEKFAIYGKIEDLAEVIDWLMNEGLISAEALDEKYGKCEADES